MKSKQTLKVGQQYKVKNSPNCPSNNGKIVTVKKLCNDDDNDSFYDENGDFYWFIIDELQLITPKKNKMKYTYTRKTIWQLLENNKMSKNITPSEHIKIQEIQKDLLAKSTTKKKSKKEWIPCDCPKGGGWEREDGSIEICPKCGGTEWIKVKKSKEIKQFTDLFYYSQKYYDLEARQSDEFRKWVKQVTDTINLLIKNK